jgi:hypothetical protein
MSLTETPADLAEIVGRALVDDRFRDQLFEDREQVLSGLGLSEEALSMLSGIDRSSLDAHAAKLGGGTLVSMIAPEPEPEPEPVPEPEPEPEPVDE